MNELNKVLTENGYTPLDRQDSFVFSCDRCGKCCRDRDDILLSAHDLNRMARYLNMSCAEFFKAYCDWHIGADSALPIMRLRPKSYRKTCPLLGKEGCKVHPVKPTVCALFPLGRAYSPETRCFQYFSTPVSCGKKESHTLQEWLDAFHMEERNTESIAWSRSVTDLTPQARELREKAPDWYFQEAMRRAAVRLYLYYDNEKPFLPQFEENLEVVKELLKP